MYAIHFWNQGVHALSAWHSGHRVRLQNRRSRVWIPPGYKVFSICSAVVIT
jgi:hypothetical protein